MAGLSKSRILLNQQCPKRLWLKVNRPDLEEESDGMKARFAAGDQVGDIARRLHPDGLLIDAGDLKGALAQTRAALDEAPRPLFEATFEHQGLLVQADLLLPEGGAWRMVEVKSSTTVKDYHLTDASVQAWVLEQAGMPLSRVEVAHVDNTFVYPGNGDYRGLLAHADIWISGTVTRSGSSCCSILTAAGICTKRRCQTIRLFRRARMVGSR